MLNYPLNTALKVKNYKCFGDDLQGFDRLMPINLIIGRNNSGKSALLDIVRFFVKPYDFGQQNGHKRRAPEVYFKCIVTRSDIDICFPAGLTLGGIGDANNYARQFVDKEINVRVDPKDGQTERSFVDIDGRALEELDLYSHQYNFRKSLVRQVRQPLSGRHFKKINAERDILPEGVRGNLDLKENGDGATNILQTWLNRDVRDASLVERDLLSSLNKIFEPDGRFTRILVKSREDAAWEIYLEEEGKGLISLTNSGSGLKTIILVLLHTIILPKQEGHSLSEYVFAFEELENNLHPALQRRLLRYLTDLQKEADCCFFLTTHSSTTIDFFGKNVDSQIIHVRNDGSVATATPALDYKDSVGILDDLDVRASDILQSNGILWVEGPSDRIYLNRLIEIWSDGQLQEGIHYQCLMYGGKLLFHINAGNPEESARGIAILRTNRNAVLVMDSDKKDAASLINATKQRIQSEMDTMRAMVWLTAGREIENYIPASILRNHYNDQTIAGPGKFTRMPEYLRRRHLSENFDKVKFADTITSLFTKEKLVQTLDLNEKLEGVCAAIRRWNGII